MTNTAVLREDLPNMTFSSYVHCIRKIKLIKFSNIYIYFIYKKVMFWIQSAYKQGVLIAGILNEI
ncbi:hypothetical protein SAMN04487817_102153 [Acinetobacter sp. yr461]|nr:hypothetical protein SAMN04487817_102153 [Acinetobacter sp. yr461]